MAVSRHDATLRNNGPVHHFPGLNWRQSLSGFSVWETLSRFAHQA